MKRIPVIAAACLLLPLLAPAQALAQCSEQPPVQHYTGAGTTTCTCFVQREQAGATFTSFDIPAAEFPIQILRVGIGWGSQFGGSPNSIEEAINIFEGGTFPNPGTEIFTLPGPEMQDGFINEFNLTTQNIIVNAPPFTVALEFANDNENQIFAPSVVHDGNGCQLGKNVVFTDAMIWFDACFLGVTGDWVFYVKYRRVDCPGRVPDGGGVPGTPLMAGLEPNGDVTLSWGDSCQAGDTDYEVYAGNLGALYDHTLKFCSTAGATSITFTPAAGDRYYLVVPTDTLAEGSYGVDSQGSERPVGISTCRDQDAGGCQ